MGSCIMYLDLPGARELLHSSARLKISPDCENLGRHGALPAVSHTHVFGLLFITKDKLSRGLGGIKEIMYFFCIFHRVYSSMYLQLRSKRSYS